MKKSLTIFLLKLLSLQLFLIPQLSFGLVNGTPINEVTGSNDQFLQDFLSRISVLHLKDRFNKNITPSPCTGIYWKNKIVITAAHCLSKMQIVEYVVIGNHSYTVGLTLVKKDFQGDLMNPLKNDIGLLILNEEPKDIKSEVEFVEDHAIGSGDKISLVGAGQSDYQSQNDFVILRKDYSFDFLARVAKDACTFFNFDTHEKRFKLKTEEVKAMGGDSGGPAFIINPLGNISYLGLMSSSSFTQVTIQRVKEDELSLDQFIDPITLYEQRTGLKIPQIFKF